MLVPETLVTEGDVGIHLDFDVGELPFAEFGVDLDVAEVALADGDQGETATVQVDLHAKVQQVGVELFREPLSFHFLVQLLDAGFKEVAFLVG